MTLTSFFSLTVRRRWVFVAVPGFFSSCGAYSLVVMRGFLLAVTSFVTERGLSSARASLIAASKVSRLGAGT